MGPQLRQNIRVNALNALAAKLLREFIRQRNGKPDLFSGKQYHLIPQHGNAQLKRSARQRNFGGLCVTTRNGDSEFNKESFWKILFAKRVFVFYEIHYVYACNDTV